MDSYQPLTKDQRERVLVSFRKVAESGEMMPKLVDSLIGLDPAVYRIEWPGLIPTENPVQGAPPELVAYGYNGTDAYITALLATKVFIAEGSTITVTCRYTRNQDDSLNLVFKSKTDNFTPELCGNRLAPFLQGFVAALSHKSMRHDSPIFCDKVGAKVWFRSPGQMVLRKSVLEMIPEVKWPLATRDVCGHGKSTHGRTIGNSPIE